MLDDAQFRKVEAATGAFQAYMESNTGYDEAGMAHILGERDDAHRSGRLFSRPPDPNYATNAAAMTSEYGGDGGGGMMFPNMQPGVMAFGYNNGVLTGGAAANFGHPNCNYGASPSQGRGGYSNAVPASNPQFGSAGQGCLQTEQCCRSCNPPPFGGFSQHGQRGGAGDEDRFD